MFTALKVLTLSAFVVTSVSAFEASAKDSSKLNGVWKETSRICSNGLMARSSAEVVGSDTLITLKDGAFTLSGTISGCTFVVKGRYQLGGNVFQTQSLSNKSSCSPNVDQNEEVDREISTMGYAMPNADTLITYDGEAHEDCAKGQVIIATLKRIQK